MRINLKKQKKETKRNQSRMAVNSTASKKEYKQSNKKSNLATKIILTVVAFLFVIVFVFVSGSFNLVEIVVENNHSLSSEQIISFSRIEKGTNVFAISKKNIKANLKESPYINEVKIRRILPNKLKLIVDERSVDYVLQLANSYIYVNQEGYVLEIASEKPNVPVLVGLTTDLSNIKENDRLIESDLQKMKAVTKIMETASNSGLANLITKVDVSNEKDYAIYFETEGKMAYLGNGTDLNTRFLYIKKLLEIHQGVPGEIIVNGDLNTEYVYFRKTIEGGEVQ